MRLEDFKELYMRRTKRDYVNTENEFHVKYLCYCRHKMENQSYEEVASKDPVMIGQLVHAGVDYVTRYNSKRVFRKEVGKYVVFGTPDLYDGEVVEVKFTGYAPKDVREHDALQLKLYLWLLDERKGYLWYFSPRETKEFEVEGGITDEDVVRLIEHPLMPMWSWECKYCSIADECIYRKF